jgi:Na+-transporting methylmalonyl-CoA/oxaloacetate decarboxylase beta subunit
MLKNKKMKKENYAELTTEDLISKKKLLGVATGTLLGALMVLLIITILLMVKKGFTPLFIIPFALSPILVMNFSQMSVISKELKSRNTNQ